MSNVQNVKELLEETARRASRYLAEIDNRRVAPSSEEIRGLEALGGVLPESSADPAEVLAALDEIGSPGTVASAGRRYFGFVTGGTLPAALVANWMAGAWDQNAALSVMSPLAAKIEEIVLGWILELLALPPTSGGGFVTGTTMANFTAMAAARSALLGRAGWNVEENGLFGAPPIDVVVGQEAHASLLKALSLLGLGRSRVFSVPADEQGRMRADRLPKLNDRTLICLQAGNVNSGAFDPAGEICSQAREAGAWVHVDAAFGLWAAISPRFADLVNGFSLADSWAIDCHKWLNVPYDSGMAIVRDVVHLRAAMSLSAAYLETRGGREPCHYTPESSRRARAIELWAAIRSLGRSGLRDLVERNCAQAKRFATRLQAAGLEVLNDVVLNQVVVSFGSRDETHRVIRELQKEGTCWCGSTEWRGRAAMRASFSSWATTDEDVEQSAEAVLRIARATGATEP